MLKAKNCSNTRPRISTTSETGTSTDILKAMAFNTKPDNICIMGNLIQCPQEKESTNPTLRNLSMKVSSAMVESKEKAECKAQITSTLLKASSTKIQSLSLVPSESTIPKMVPNHIQLSLTTILNRRPKSTTMMEEST